MSHRDRDHTVSLAGTDYHPLLLGLTGTRATSLLELTGSEYSPLLLEPDRHGEYTSFPGTDRNRGHTCFTVTHWHRRATPLPRLLGTEATPYSLAQNLLTCTERDRKNSHAFFARTDGYRGISPSLGLMGTARITKTKTLIQLRLSPKFLSSTH